MKITSIDESLLGERRPLLLVHGWSAMGMPSDFSGDGWDNFIKFYNSNEDLKREYKIYLAQYKSNLISVNDIGFLLRKKIDELKMRDITIVAHSMGGLVSRSFMEHSINGGVKGGELVEKLITLGTPHHGSPMANGSIRTLNRPWLIESIIDFDKLLFEVKETYVIDILTPGLGKILPIFKVSSNQLGPLSYQFNRLDMHWDNFDDFL